MPAQQHALMCTAVAVHCISAWSDSQHCLHALCPLAALPHVLGDPAADIVITLHVVLRKPQAAKPAGEAPWAGGGWQQPQRLVLDVVGWLCGRLLAVGQWLSTALAYPTAADEHRIAPLPSLQRPSSSQRTAKAAVLSAEHRCRARGVLPHAQLFHRSPLPAGDLSSC